MITKPIPSLPGYVSCDDGRIMCLPYTKQMPRGGFRTYGGGEPTRGIWKKEGRFCIYYRGKNYKVARLICEAFHGPAPDGAVCMHLNEDASDNRPENLAWGTQKENLNAPGFIKYCKSRVGDESPVRKGRR